jgi:hypothetical protein
VSEPPLPCSFVVQGGRRSCVAAGRCGVRQESAKSVIQCQWCPVKGAPRTWGGGGAPAPPPHTTPRGAASLHPPPRCQRRLSALPLLQPPPALARAAGHRRPDRSAAAALVAVPASALLRRARSTLPSAWAAIHEVQCSSPGLVCHTPRACSHAPPATRVRWTVAPVTLAAARAQLSSGTPRDHVCFQGADSAASCQTQHCDLEQIAPLITYHI